jgi:hypothetical protein
MQQSGEERAALSDDELAEVVNAIAGRLGETEPEPLQRLHEVVKMLGPERSFKWLQKTLEVEAQGGMVTVDGTRRRTPGGTFFYLVRTRGPRSARYLWREPRPDGAKALGRSKKNGQLGLSWVDREAVLQEIGQEKGLLRTVKITLIGRPGKVVDRGTCVVMSMQGAKVPALPKGVPTPPEVTTSYVVYVAGKQWKKVAEALRDEDDVLIVEGFPQLDTKTGSIAVFVTNVTTKNLQSAKREK